MNAPSDSSRLTIFWRQKLHISLGRFSHISHMYFNRFRQPHLYKDSSKKGFKLCIHIWRDHAYIHLQVGYKFFFYIGPFDVQIQWSVFRHWVEFDVQSFDIQFFNVRSIRSWVFFNVQSFYVLSFNVRHFDGHCVLNTVLLHIAFRCWVGEPGKPEEEG
jgi:hypothetical protein